MSYMSFIFLLRHIYFFLSSTHCFEDPEMMRCTWTGTKKAWDKSLYLPTPSLSDCAGSDENSTCSLAGDHARWRRARDWGN